MTVRSTAPSNPASERTQALERLVRRAPDFDLISLIDVLSLLGYGAEDILLRCHTGQQSSVQQVHGLTFQPEAQRPVVISLNAGLLSATTPLPSYFFRLLELNGVNEGALIAFLGCFDHPLLWQQYLSTLPERAGAYLGEWALLSQCFQTMVRLSSPDGMEWLFSRTFPELGVRVSRATHTHEMPMTGVCLGETPLGSSSALGGRKVQATGGFDVTLVGEREQAPSGLLWQEEAQKRLEQQVWPALGASPVSLSVQLRFELPRPGVQLERMPTLGYRPLAREALQPLAIPIFYGISPGSAGQVGGAVGVVPGA